jgi:hypothetical protein
MKIKRKRIERKKIVDNENVISKGFYGFSQIKDFISVKNHMFLTSGNKMYLSIRFSNDSNVTFESFSFDIIQLDSSGRSIGKIFVDYKDIVFEPGSTYISKNAVAVSPRCADFKIVFHEAFSRAYRYGIRRNSELVYYDRKKDLSLREKTTDNNGKKSAAYFRIKEKKAGKPGLAVLLTIVLFIAMLLFSSYSMYSSFEKEKEENDGGFITELPYDGTHEMDGVIYAEI